MAVVFRCEWRTGKTRNDSKGKSRLDLEIFTLCSVHNSSRKTVDYKAYADESFIVRQAKDYANFKPEATLLSRDFPSDASQISGRDSFSSCP